MKRLYNGILSGIDTTLINGDKAAERYLASFTEKFVKIMRLSANMNTDETLIFRKIFNNICKNHNYVTCVIPNKVKSSLIVLSKRKLTNNDFVKFPDDTKEYDFRCGAEYIHIEVNQPDIKDMITKSKSSSGTIIKGDEFSVISLGNSDIIFNDKLMYITIKSNLFVRLVLSFSKNKLNNLSRDINN